MHTNNIAMQSVSIHTPTKGVTKLEQRVCHKTTGFNPHTHEGCDSNGVVLQAHRNVSIHTPTKGVTKHPVTLK